MRRLFALGCALALVAALVIPAPQPADAQAVLTGPGGLINSSGASVTVTNTTTATSLYSYQVPAGLTQGNFGPLHLKLLGRVTTNVASGGVGNINVGCNYGGSTASIALVNALALDANMTNTPVTLDLWLTGYTAAQANGITASLQGRFAYQSATAQTEKQMAAQVDGTTALSTPQTITCVWQWASAAATNSLVITNGHLVIGE